MMKKYAISFITLGILILCCSFVTNADNTLLVKTRAFDLFTTEPVKGPKVYLLILPDSIVQNEWIPANYLNGECIPINDIGVNINDRSKKYLLKVEKEGYKTEYLSIDPSKIGQSQVELPLDPIYLEPKGKELKEVTVTASKVKFYHRGDTLVYNADAFVLPEGSMLDALLEQLPGVKMDDDGVISVDGKRVDYLLLDGKEFFSNDRKLILKNIASYTVKTVDVYESHDERYDAARPGQEKLMMDVKLKKQYQKGYIANVEAGYGTSDRWLGRLFGMVYTNMLRFTLLGNTNNLNDERRPARDGAWSPEQLQPGEKKSTKGAIDYYYDSKDKGFTVNGTVDVTHADLYNLTSNNITSFLPSGNRYGYSFLTQNNEGLTIKTNHHFFMEKPNQVLDVFADYRYGKTRRKDRSSSAEFTRDLQNVNEETISSLYGGGGVDIADIVNRVFSTDLTEGHDSEGYISAKYKYKFLKYGSYLEFYLRNTLSMKHDDRVQDYMLNIGGTPVVTERLERDFHNYPDHRYMMEGSVMWAKNLTSALWWYETYTYNHDSWNSTSNVWSMTDSQVPDNFISPSIRENFPPMVPDYAAGFRSKRREDTHQLESQLDYFTGRWMWQVKLPVRYADRQIWYERNFMTTQPKNKNISVNPNIVINFIHDQERYQMISFRYHLQEYFTDLLNLVDIPNTTDPLNIFIGNKNLKNILRQDVSLRGGFRKGKTGHSLNASHTYWHNAIARGFSYDQTTGVRTFTPMNINGNNEWRASYSFDVSFGHMDRFSLSNSLEFVRLTNYDFVSEDEIEMTKSRVRTLTFRDRPKLSYGFSGSKVTLFGDLALSRYTGSLSSFEAFNAGTVNYGVSGTFKLPYNFGITTDFTIYMRRGYNDLALNTNNYVWNARLSYSIPKAHLLFMLDGWDLLHDIKNVSYTVNAQGRTETYTTILPRYLMLHVQWNFNKQPKRR